MSLDLYLRTPPCPHCDAIQDTKSLNYTYNCAPMWYEIYPEDKRFVEIEGMSGEVSAIKLKVALAVLEERPEVFTAMNPANGWGSYRTFMNFIRELIALAEMHPNWIWVACR